MANVVLGSVSLFSGGGVGDCGVHYGAGVPVIACCELLPARCALIREMLPETQVFEGDVTHLSDELVAHVQHQTAGRRPLLLTMSPPCQGMSEVTGYRNDADSRNRLIIPAIEIVERLRPEWLVLENVPRMRKTRVKNERGKQEFILDMLRRRLKDYTVKDEILATHDYGVPQRRVRLFVIGRRRQDDVVPYHPAPSHGPQLTPHVTLEAACGHLAWLDAVDRPRCDNDPIHHVPVWKEHTHFWMRNTPPGRSALENTQCVTCATDHDDDSIACRGCNRWLARPRTHVNHPTKESRLVRGFSTIYARMRPNEPVPTLTTGSGNVSSEVKCHPTQHRTLSIREVLIAGSVSGYPGNDVPWGEACLPLETRSATVVREVVGESIPPLMLCAIVRHILAVHAAG